VLAEETAREEHTLPLKEPREADYFRTEFSSTKMVLQERRGAMIRSGGVEKGCAGGCCNRGVSFLPSTESAAWPPAEGCGGPSLSMAG